MKLSNEIARKEPLPTGKTEAIFFDGALPGFGVRVREGGSRTWLYQYKIGAKHRRVTIGRVSAMDVTRARRAASDMAAQVRLGRDPAGERDEGRARASETFGVIVNRFLAFKRTELKPRTYEEYARHLLKHAKSLHGLQLAKVDKRTIADRLTMIGADSPVTANRVRASLGAFFSWAIKAGLVDANPALNTNKNSETARERVLTEDELKSIWNAAAKVNHHYGTIVRLLLLTGQRRVEIGDLRWTEIDFTVGVIRLPGERTKNHRPHEVPMSSAVRALLAAQTKAEDRDLVFGSRVGGFSGWSKAKAQLDKAAGIAPWRLHDLRRSAATYMGEIGIPPHIIEAVLNHVSGHKGGVAGVYNKAIYPKEKADALMLWAEHVAGIVEGRQSITPLRGA
jgi:integrase